MLVSVLHILHVFFKSREGGEPSFTSGYSGNGGLAGRLDFLASASVQKKQGPGSKLAGSTTLDDFPVSVHRSREEAGLCQ